jgi:hypothetical protein
MAKQKLLIINPNQFGYATGFHYYCKYIQPYFEIDFLCFDQGLKKITEEGTIIYYQIYNRNKIIRLLYFIYFAFKLSRQKKYDVLLTTNFKFVFVLGAFCSCKKKILDIRSGNLHKNKLIRWHKNLGITLSSLFFDKVIVVSGGLAKLLKLSSLNTFIIPLGADIIDNTQKIYNKLNLIYVGSLNNRNIDKTIEGLNLFIQKYKNYKAIHYDIIGFGTKEDEETLNNVIQRNNLQDLVQFQGRKSHQELPVYFANATVGISFIPQTPYYDIQPATKLFEYALSGLINIATNTTENKLLITKDNGVLCDDNPHSFFEALEKVYHSLSNYDEYMIRSTLSGHSWKKITLETLLPVMDENIQISKD